jgi:hypothetical protein
MWNRIDEDRWVATQDGPGQDGSRNLLLRRGGRLAEFHYGDGSAFIHVFEGEAGDVEGWPLGEPGADAIVRHVGTTDVTDRSDLDGREESAWAALLEAIE